MNGKNIKSMLTQYEKNRVREQTKIREVLQQVALLGLERQGFFEKAAFYGGTALRILHGLDRFSEDLDFTLLKKDGDFNINPFLEGLKRELASLGFNMEVTKKEKSIDTSVVSAFMKMNTIELYLAIGEEQKAKTFNHNEKIQIKLEVDTTPPPATARYENLLVLNPVTFYVLTLHISDLFAGKMAAILYRAWKNRVKGRDWYDLIWYVQKKIPLNLTYLESYMRQIGTLEADKELTPADLQNKLHERILSIDWESAKQDMRPFIADPQRLDIWNTNFFHQLIPHIITEKL